MSELTLMLVRFGYLAILWIFVLSAVSVIRSDMFGARVEGVGAAPAKQPAPREARPKARKGAPRVVAIIEGPNSGQSVELVGQSLLIGRGADAAIQLDDDYASTRHARLAFSGEQWFVEDLGSTNGTYLGSQRLSQATAITVGTRIRIGKSVLEIRK
jgi:hypothetical protein